MSGRRRGPTFAETVQQVRSAPAVEVPVPRGCLNGSGQLIDPVGRCFERVAGDISPRAALAAAAEGAALVWDPCGYGGYCDLRWFDAAAVTRMVAFGAPTVRHRKDRLTHISSWMAADGAVVLMAVDDVRWGDALA